MKKINFVLLSVACLVLALALAGCSSKQPAPKPSGATSQTSGADEPKIPEH